MHHSIALIKVCTFSQIWIFLHLGYHLSPIIIYGLERCRSLLIEPSGFSVTPSPLNILSPEIFEKLKPEISSFGTPFLWKAHQCSYCSWETVTPWSGRFVCFQDLNYIPAHCLSPRFSGGSSFLKGLRGLFAHYYYFFVLLELFTSPLLTDDSHSHQKPVFEVFAVTMMFITTVVFPFTQKII